MARRIVRQQSDIVQHEPERALATLPAPVRTAEDRRRRREILERLAEHLDFADAQTARMPEFRRLMAPKAPPAPVAAAGATPQAPGRRTRPGRSQRAHR